MKSTLRYIGWPLLLLALIVWGGVGLFANTILTDEADRAARIQSLQEAESKGASAARLRVLAQETKREREQLDALFTQDAVSVVETIEAAGKVSGAKLAVSNVQPEGAPLSETVNGSQIIVTGFVVEAQGTFTALMHLIRLLETFPAPSKLGRVDIERANPTASGPALWRLSAVIRVLTASNISS